MRKIIFNPKGQGLIEYLLVVSLVAVVSMVVLRSLGQTVAANFTTITNALQGHANKAATPKVDDNAFRKKDMSDFFKGAAGADDRAQQ